MKRFVLEVGLLAALCALPAWSARASFAATNGPYWPGETDYYYGITKITTALTLTNSGSMITNTSTFPADTGPLPPGTVSSVGNYYWAVGILDWGADGATIINNSGGTIQGIVTGTGEGQGDGIVSLQAVTINNSGWIDGEVTNHDGWACGVYANSGGLTVNNATGATISAASPYSATAIQCANSVSITNNGTIRVVGYAGTQGATAKQANAYTIGTGGGEPINVVNNGTLTAVCPSTTATNTAQVYTIWNNAPNTFINTGLMYCENDSSVGNASDFYYGVQGYNESIFNSGMITNYSVNGHGWAVLWMENDADNGNHIIYNTGTMACNSSSMDVVFAGGFGPPGNNWIYYTNSGTFNGGSLILAFPGTAVEAGQILTSAYGLSDGSQMHVTGLPTINPTINGGGSGSTLDFNLVGTLQKINGTTTSGTNFSGLSGSGSIVVSGKTYSWENFSNGVFGTVSAAGYVPPPWQSQDLGPVGVAGGAVYGGGLLTVLASGSRIGGTGDECHYVYQSLSSNCTLSAQVSLALNTNANALAGVMIRDSLNTNGANAFIGVMPGNIVVWECRASDGGGSSSNGVTGLSESYYVKLAQSGTTLTGYYSVDGVNWTQLGSTTISSLGASNYGGLAFANNNNSTFNTATFANIICTGGLLVPSVPMGVTAVAGLEQVTLNWQAASNAAGYNIGISTANGGPYTTIASVSTTNYTDLDLAGRTTYYYVVTAVTPGSQGTNSAQVSATPTANVPAPWVAQDLGIVAVDGSESYSNSVFTVTASGSDYDASYTYTVNTSDDFRFVYVTNNSGNCTIIARVASEQGGNAWSKAGVTIRDSLNANAANVFIGMTPTTNGVVLENRASDSAMGSFDTNVIHLSIPYWVKLVQSGNTFTGYYSANGSSWTNLGTETVSMGATEYVGMAVCANDNGTGEVNNPATTTFTATFDNVTVPGWPLLATPTGLTATAGNGQVALNWMAVTNATSYNVQRAATSGGPYTNLASVTTTNYADTGVVVGTTYYYVVAAQNSAGQSTNSAQASATLTVNEPSFWLTQDLGAVGTAGSVNFSNGVFTVAGAGAGIGNTNDAFRFVYVPVTGACTIVARVVSMQSINPWSEAGVMIRDSLATNAANAFMAITPGNGVTWQYRSSDGGGTSTNNTAGPSAPYWVKLVWSGTTFTGYSAPDGVTWTQQGTAAFTMPATNYVGLAVASGNTSTLCAATFDNVTTTGWTNYTLPPAPASLAATGGNGQVVLTWMAVSNATSYNVQRAVTFGGPYTVFTNLTATNFTDTAVANGTYYYYVVSALNQAGQGPDSAQACAAPTVTGSLPSFWLTQDIGPVGMTGSANWTNGVFTVLGGGPDIDQSTINAFRFVYVPVTGSCTIIARVASLTNADTSGSYYSYVKSGVMICGSLATNAANAFMGVSMGSGTLWQYRTSTGTGAGSWTAGSGSAPYWVELVWNASAGTFTGYCAPDGVTWTQVGTESFAMPSNTVYVGLAVTSPYNNYLTKATFDNVTVPGWADYTNSPPAPAGLAATAGSGQVVLTWTAVTNATSYNVMRAVTSGGPYTLLANLATTNFTDTAVVNGTSYYYVVSALNPAGQSTNSAQASATPALVAPGAPVGLTATAVSSSQINLAWNAATGAASYNVQRSTTNGGPYAVLASGVTATNYNDTGLAATTTYYYVVNAVNSGGASANSAQASATTMLAPPLAPAGLTATAVASNQINLVWNLITNAASYNVKRSLTNGGPCAVIASGVIATNYNDTGLAAATTYYYVVSAVNAAGESPNSAQASATTPTPPPVSLVHWYRFSETGGNTVADSVGGPAWTGTLPNGGTLSGGQLALVSTSQQYASLPTGLVASLTNVTVTAWVNLASLANGNRVFDFGSGTTNYMYLTPRNASSATLLFGITTNGSGAEQQITCTNKLSAGVWYQMAVTLSGGTGILYVAGAPVGTNSGLTVNPSSLGGTVSNYLGKAQSGSVYLNGALEDFRIYNVGLSAADIAAMAVLGPDQMLSANSPQLGLTLTRTNLMLGWPVANPDFTVQACTNLALGGWLNVTSLAPQIVGSNWQVTLPPATNAMPVYYRLAQ